MGLGLRVVVYSLAGVASFDRDLLKKGYFSAYTIFKLVLVRPRYQHNSSAQVSTWYYN